MAAPVLEIVGLTVEATTPSLGAVYPVTDVSFALGTGEVVGLIGESGCGKTTVVRALIGLLAQNAAIVQGDIRFQGRTILTAGKGNYEDFRGEHVGVVFQNAMSSLNPLMKIRTQIDETLRRHRPSMSRADRRRVIKANLTRLGFDDVARVLQSYPHQLSGGMRQRVAIALATVLEPEVVVADECTTALDVTTQAEVIELLSELSARDGASLLFVTHDLLLASEICTRILVMYAGQVVEEGPVDVVLGNPKHPYTRALIRAVPAWGPRRELEGIPGMPSLVRKGDTGCRFADRCSFVEPECREAEIPWFELPGGRGHRCRHPSVNIN
jgi:peptide/nickel transport system ATP-binding protein